MTLQLVSTLRHVVTSLRSAFWFSSPKPSWFPLCSGKTSCQPRQPDVFSVTALKTFLTDIVCSELQCRRRICWLRSQIFPVKTKKEAKRETERWTVCTEWKLMCGTLIQSSRILVCESCLRWFIADIRPGHKTTCDHRDLQCYSANKDTDRQERFFH